MKIKAFSPKMELKSYNFVNTLSFNDNYDKIYSYSVQTNLPKEKTYVNVDAEVCAFCPAKKSKGDCFKLDAHVIPAFLSDPKLLSHEECSACNKKFGKEYEDELCKMLNPYLVISNISRRKQKTRKAKNDKYEILYTGNNSIDYLSPEDPIINEEDGTLQIKVPSNSFNPQKALRSLLHTFWLLIDKDTRNEELWIKDALSDINISIPDKIYLGSHIKDKHKISIHIYKNKSGDQRLSNYLLKLTFGLYFIYYGIDRSKTKIFLAEPILVNNIPPCPPTLSFIDFKNNTYIKSNALDVPYTFESFVKEEFISKVSEDEAKKILVNKSTKSIIKKKEILASLLVNNKVYINSTAVKIFEHKTIISGYDFIGNIELLTSKQKIEMKIFYDFNNKKILNLKKTLNFIKAAKDIGNFTINPLNGDTPITLPFGKIEIDEQLSILINMLYEISTYFNREIVYNSIEDNKELKSIFFLQNIINKKLLIGNSITLGIEGVENFIEEIDKFKNQNFTLEYPKEIIEILNIKINLSEFLVYEFVNFNKIQNENGLIKILAKEIYIKTKKN